jgi:hypothetical protein
MDVRMCCPSCDGWVVLAPRLRHHGPNGGTCERCGRVYDVTGAALTPRSWPGETAIGAPDAGRYLAADRRPR